MTKSTQSRHLKPPTSKHVHQRFAHPKPSIKSDCPHCFGKGYKIKFTIGLASTCTCNHCGKDFLKAGI